MKLSRNPPACFWLMSLKIDLPYIVMLSMAVLGIGLVTFTGDPHWILLGAVNASLLWHLYSYRMAARSHQE